MKEVYVFGTDKFKLIKNRKMEWGFCPRRSQHTVEIYNEKLDIWQKYPCDETIIECPVCGKPFRAYYVVGTTWLAFDSEECAKKFDEKLKELGDLFKTLRYFREKRMVK